MIIFNDIPFILKLTSRPLINIPRALSSHKFSLISVLFAFLLVQSCSLTSGYVKLEFLSPIVVPANSVVFLCRFRVNTNELMALLSRQRPLRRWVISHLNSLVPTAAPAPTIALNMSLFSQQNTST